MHFFHSVRVARIPQIKNEADHSRRHRLHLYLFRLSFQWRENEQFGHLGLVAKMDIPQHEPFLSLRRAEK